VASPKLQQLVEVCGICYFQSMAKRVSRESVRTGVGGAAKTSGDANESVGKPWQMVAAGRR